MITKCTITGADDSINVEELIFLQVAFPFVEWGILASPTRFGTVRFPSIDFVKDISSAQMPNLKPMDLSLHLCGAYVGELAKGNNWFEEQIDLSAFNRIQINFHGILTPVVDEFWTILRKLSDSGKEIIFQCDAINNHLLMEAFERRINASALFDLSHGAGISPEQWPEPIPHISCGYAGGLGPDNLERQIELIEEKAGETKIWIDMETKVRSEQDRKFDLEKVQRCLEIVGKVIA